MEEKKYLEINNKKMAFIDEGEKEIQSYFSMAIPHLHTSGEI